MTITDIKEKRSNALDCFYSENKEILKNWKTNKSYVSAFSKILEREFDSWDIDCYFVHYNEHKFSAFLDKDCFCKEKDTSVTCEECLNWKWCNACPDIIIHHRNSQENLLIIQTALSCNNQSKKEQNLSKIKRHINCSDSSYQYGLFINWAPSRNQVSLTWLSHSILKRQESLNHRKEKEDGKYYIESYSAFKTPRVKPDNYIVGLLDILGAQERLKNAMSELTFINSLNYNYYFLDYLKTEGM